MTLMTRESQFCQEGKPLKLWGIRVASGIFNAAATDNLIAQLDDYRASGITAITAITAFYQGSGGSQDAFSPNKRIIDPDNPDNQARMEPSVGRCGLRSLTMVCSNRQ